MEFFNNSVVPYFNYWIYVILMMIGLHAMITKNNLIKKLIGMTIFQTAIILLYVSIGVKSGATIPILAHHHDDHGEETESAHHGEPDHGHTEADAEAHAKAGAPSEVEKPDRPGDGEYEKEKKDDHHDHGDPHHDSHAVNPDHFANPLPHVLMLTAIVVGVSTLGVALAISQSIYRNFGSLEEDEILAKIKQGGSGADV